MIGIDILFELSSLNNKGDINIPQSNRIYSIMNESHQYSVQIELLGSLGNKQKPWYSFLN